MSCATSTQPRPQLVRLECPEFIPPTMTRPKHPLGLVAGPSVHSSKLMRDPLMSIRMQILGLFESDDAETPGVSLALQTS